MKFLLFTVFLSFCSAKKEAFFSTSSPSHDNVHRHNARLIFGVNRGGGIFSNSLDKTESFLSKEVKPRADKLDEAVEKKAAKAKQTAKRAKNDATEKAKELEIKAKAKAKDYEEQAKVKAKEIEKKAKAKAKDYEDQATNFLNKKVEEETEKKSWFGTLMK